MAPTMHKTGRIAAMAVMGLSALFAPGATACESLTHRMSPGVLAALPLSRLPEPALRPPAPPSQDSSEHAMTGLWKTVSMADGAVVMVAFDTWHSDGTELALDGSFPPATGNVCPGVWEKTGPRTYSTIHPAFEYDPAGINIVAIFIERMHVTLSDDGNSFQGTFSWDNFDFQGTLLPGSVAGTVAGTRIRAGAEFPFPFPL